MSNIELKISKNTDIDVAVFKTKDSWNNLMYEISLNNEQIQKEFDKLKKKKIGAFAGNKLLYHYFGNELFSTKRTSKTGTVIPSIKDMFLTDILRKKCLQNCFKYPRRKKCSYINAKDMMESWRRMKGSVNFFKASSCIGYLRNKKPVIAYLDPCAGWGGRLLGAWSCNVKYIGYEVNTNLMKPYIDLLKNIDTDVEVINHKTYKTIISNNGNYIVNFVSCLEDDLFPEFDFCLTSPPYANVERYNNMDLFKDRKDYYKNFLVPLIIKLCRSAVEGAFIGINVSNYLMEECLEYLPIKYHPVNKEYLGQQLGGKKNKEIIYIFEKNNC